MKIYLAYVFVFYLISLSVARFLKNKVVQKVIKLDRYDICDAPSTSPFEKYNFAITTMQHKSFVHGSFTLLRNIDRIMTITSIYRCAHKDVLDSCILFATLTSRDGCDIIKQKGTFVSSMIYTYKPPLICPFQKGNYIIVNGSYDPNMLQFFPLENWYWKYDWKVYDYNTKEYYCTVCVAGQILVNVE